MCLSIIQDGDWIEWARIFLWNDIVHHADSSRLYAQVCTLRTERKIHVNISSFKIEFYDIPCINLPIYVTQKPIQNVSYANELSVGIPPVHVYHTVVYFQRLL